MNNEARWTPGPWSAFNMVHEETGEQMTPDEIGEYVKNAVLKGDPNRFLFVAQPGEGFDVCHVGNGPAGPYNAHLIATAPELYDALKVAHDNLYALINDPELGPEVRKLYDLEDVAAMARPLAKARGKEKTDDLLY